MDPALFLFRPTNQRFHSGKEDAPLGYLTCTILSTHVYLSLAPHHPSLPSKVVINILKDELSSEVEEQ